MVEKSKKNLFLPKWISELLDKEGENYGGPGVVAAASIHNFSEMNKKNKKLILKKFRSKEIEQAYQDLPDSSKAAVEDENVAASASAKSKHKQSRRRIAKNQQ